ncbi:hypothetical protein CAUPRSCDRAFT_7139, partial [Caulochytrium protostelioides]
YFGYIPNRPLWAVACAIFTLSTVAHTWQAIKSRRWIFSLWVICGILEIAGTGARVAAQSYPKVQTFTLFITQEVAMIIAPTFLNALLNGLFAMLARSISPELALFGRPKLLAGFLMVADVGGLFLQGAGGGISGSAVSNYSNLKTGQDVTLAGIIFQLIFLTAFCAVHAHFLYLAITITKNKADTSPRACGIRERTLALKETLWVITTMIVLLYIRQIYRVIQLSNGWESKFALVEWPLVVFDTLFVAVVMVMGSIWHYDRIFLQVVKAWRTTHPTDGAASSASESPSVPKGPELNAGTADAKSPRSPDNPEMSYHTAATKSAV